MPIPINNDQNINRVYTKMSEDFSNKNNANLSNCVNTIEYFEEINDTDECTEQINIPYDHMYASNNENSEEDNNCQSSKSEVRFLKDWLILHLDLIQQQNDDILDKENTILILQKENEMLKERIKCMEQGTPFQPNINFHKSQITEEYGEENFSEDMTQDSGPCDEDNKDTIELLDVHCDSNVDNCSLKLINFGENRLNDNESHQNRNITSSPVNDIEITELKSEDFIVNDLSEDIKSENEVTECNNSVTDFNFSLDNCSEFDPMRNLRMSIRRKRLCSNSSALSNNDSPTEEKRSYKKFKKKRRRITKDTQTLTTPEEYVTQAGDVNLGISVDTESEMVTNANLEVPRWRVKLYASCYTMEGTENLDDKVYNKRHSRLENDERRRKRWDVQRIREQRVVEKLKQRQERVGSGSRGDEQSESVQSLWPKVDDIKFLEVSEELPISAFGCPIPKISPCEFNLPWLNDPLLTKKVHTKRSSMKRKNSKR